MEVIEFKYRCSEAIGRRLESETPVEYVRRAGYEIERIEALLERHIMWWTHKNLTAAECPICAIFVVSRGLVRDYEGMLGGDVTEQPGDDESDEGAGVEDINRASSLLDNQE